MKKTNQGIIATEFVIAFPFIIVLTMLVLEFASWMLDKHIMKLAAFEAARILATSHDANPCMDHRVVKRAKLASALKMSVISPDIRRVLLDLKMNVPPNTLQNFGGNKVLRAVQYLFYRFPTAYVYSKLSCQYDATKDLVSAKLTYARPAKTPFGGSIVWLMYILMKMNKALDHTNIDLVKYGLDDDFASINGHSPAARKTLEKIHNLRAEIKSWMDLGTQIDLNQSSVFNFISGIPELQDYIDPSVLANFTGNASQLLTVLDTNLGTAEVMAQQVNAHLQEGIDKQTKFLTAIFHAVPESFKVIPNRTEVSLYRLNAKPNSNDSWPEGKSRFLMKFSRDGAGSGSAEKVWQDWVEGMSKHSSDLETAFDPRASPGSKK